MSNTDICPSFSENWDIRDDNLRKQSHLLSKGELKKRGITRYDAEILLSQGLKLPEPKAVVQKKLLSPHRIVRTAGKLRHFDIHFLSTPVVYIDYVVNVNLPVSLTIILK